MGRASGVTAAMKWQKSNRKLQDFSERFDPFSVKCRLLYIFSLEYFILVKIIMCVANFLLKWHLYRQLCTYRSTVSVFRKTIYFVAFTGVDSTVMCLFVQNSLRSA